MLWGIGNTDNNEKKHRLSFAATMIVLVVSSVVIAGALSLVASSDPDGLEWSIEKITGTTELENSGAVYEQAEQVQTTTALLPDYSFKNSESPAGTSVSGIAGSLVVIAVCTAACYLFKFFKKGKKDKINEQA